MSGNDDGSAPAATDSSNSGDRQGHVVSRSRTVGARSASPAKRSAADMEGLKYVPGSFNSVPEEHRVPGSFTDDEDPKPSDYDISMAGMASAEQSGDTQESVTNSMANSNIDSASTSATSFQSQDASDDSPQPEPHAEPYTREEMNQQVNHVQKAMDGIPLDEGSRGVVISKKWLSRVLARTTYGQNNPDFTKEVTEGVVGPVDNLDILPKGAFDEPVLHDANGAPFIPMKPGVLMNTDCDVVPYDAYGYIVGQYGTKHNFPIVRYAHDTAEPGSAQANIMYEMYPPVVTVRKVPQPNQEPRAAPKAKKTLDSLRLKKEREGRGQQSEDDAIRLVSSRSERFQKFLTRAKEAAGIPLATKVKIWRLMDASKVSIDEPSNKQSGVLSPPASREASPNKAAAVKLVLDSEAWSRMEIGRDIEALDVSDSTNDANYNGKSSMGLVGFFDDSTIVLEEQTGGPGGGEFPSDSKKPTGKGMLNKKSAGSKPASAPGSGRNSPAPGGSSMMTRGRTRRDGRTTGVTGLTNLGNTCYMNSALQCIRSVEELAVYFLSNKYKPEINNDNPLGHHGAMANAYAGVLRGIYGANSGNAFSPRDFKSTLGRIQPMFSGYGQQDSQEFLSFLVDALHEDLNRIQKKPYLENPDSDDSRVKDPEYIRELGEVYRNNHRQRNDSIAMDLFSGFYKNTMECPVCDKISVTFDPYSLLTVQLPMDHAFTHHITFIPHKDKPVIHAIDMDKMSTIKTLKEYIASKHPGVDANRLWMIEVWSNKVYKTFDDQTTLIESGINQNDHIFMYELEQVPKNTPSTKKTFSSYGFYNNKNSEDSIPEDRMESPKADVFAVPIFHRAEKGKSGSLGPAMHPLYITLTREEAKDYDTILKKILVAVSSVTSKSFLMELDQNGAPHAEKETATGEDAAGVSDHSAQSEESYVDVSLAKPTASETHDDNSSPMQLDKIEDAVPAGFMEPQYFIAPALRTHLFEIKWFESSDGNIHCASTNLQFQTAQLGSILDRVRQPARRASMQSSASEESTTSSGTGDQEAQEGDASEADEDVPDIVLGQSVPEAREDESEDELAGSSPTINPARSGRDKRGGKRRGGKKSRFNKHNSQVTYGKKDRQLYGQQNRNNGFKSSTSSGKQPLDSPYYIELGQAIVLDWRPEAWDSLFGGDPHDEQEMRGHRFVDDDGKQGHIFEDKELEARKSRRAERKKNGVDLEDCFAETSKKEKLSEDNAWYCNRCKELRQAYKQLDIWTLPEILVVHMKRFGGGRSLRDKIELFVDYPIEGLDLNDKVGIKEDGKDYTYDLFAVDCHFGGLGGGHYTAMAKNFNDQRWYEYNDSSASSTTSVKTAAAYLLFYRRRSDEPLGPQSLQDLVNTFRNPPETVDGAEDEGESGEGRLGGPIRSSQHGSSSALAGVGVGVTSSLTGLGASGGAGADSHQTTRQTMTTNPDGDWSFDNLNSGNDGDEAKGLLDDMDGADLDSTKAEGGDRDSAYGDSSTGGFRDSMDVSSLNTTPPDDYMDLEDNCAPVESIYGGHGHVEDLPAHEIHVDETQLDGAAEHDDYAAD